MKYALTTGRAAQLLGVSEPQLSETVRRGKVRPAPSIRAGRRLWFAEHLLQAANALNVLDESLRERIENAAPTTGIVATPVGGVTPQGSGTTLTSPGDANSPSPDHAPEVRQ